MAIGALLVASVTMAMAPAQQQQTPFALVVDSLVRTPFAPKTSLNDLMSQQLSDPRVLAEIKVTDEQIAAAGKRAATALFTLISTVSAGEGGMTVDATKMIAPFENNGYNLDMFSATQKVALRRKVLKDYPFESMFTTEVQLALNLRAAQIEKLTSLGKQQAETIAKKKEKDARMMAVVKKLVALYEQGEPETGSTNPMGLFLDAAGRSMEIAGAVMKADRKRLDTTALALLDGSQRARLRGLVANK